MAVLATSTDPTPHDLPLAREIVHARVHNLAAPLPRAGAAT